MHTQYKIELVLIVIALIGCFVLAGNAIYEAANREGLKEGITTFENGREVQRFWYEGYITTKVGDGWAEIIFENVPED